MSTTPNLACPKCGSHNITLQVVTDVKTKHRGILGWIGWIFLAVCTLGLVILIPLLTSKTTSEHHSQALCQDCGHLWRP